jgi:hypothetical protein
MDRRRLLSAALRSAAGATALLAAPRAAAARAPAERPPSQDARRPGLTDAEIAARRRHFGLENVDPATGAVRPDRVVLSWVGVTNFAMALRGHVVLLDAWVPRGAHSGYVPTSPGELAALRPAAIFIGHGHFDHAADAGAIAAASGATVVGTRAHGEQADQDAGPDHDVDTVTAVPPDARPGDAHRVPVLPGVEVLAVSHLHSAAQPPDLDDPNGPRAPLAPPPDPRTTAQHPPRPEDVRHLLEHGGHDEGGCVLYQFRVGDFTLTWNDTVGPLPEEGPEVLDALRALPRTDVHLGAIQGFGQLTNGLRDPRLYIEALRPRLFVPTHHDDWLAGITTRGEHYEEPLTAELETIPGQHRPEVRFLYDPVDYVRPEVLTFDPAAPVWRG